MRLLRDRNFVTVKINYSEESENKKVLARYGVLRVTLTCSCSIGTANSCSRRTPVRLRVASSTILRSLRRS